MNNIIQVKINLKVSKETMHCMVQKNKNIKRHRKLKKDLFTENLNQVLSVSSLIPKRKHLAMNLLYQPISKLRTFHLTTCYECQRGDDLAGAAAFPVPSYIETLLYYSEKCICFLLQNGRCTMQLKFGYLPMK